MARFPTVYCRYTLATVCVLLIYITITESKSQSTHKNHELLTKIGFSRVKAPNSHHRKRLAVESRHHSRSDDSHMFIIKLPPNQHYYAHNKPNTYIEPDKKVPVGFKSNGKPGKIYHWNIPVIKKIVAAKSKSRLNDEDSNIVDLKYQNWNEVLDKPTNNVRQNYKKPLYYVPTKLKKSSFLKYFPGNGKPQSFYVIEKNKKKHHHRLLQ